MESKIGFIGLGNLGAPIASNLLESGHALYVYNRTISKRQPFVEKGAVICDSISALAAQCNIVFTIVSDDAALRNICTGENGLLENLQKGSIHVSMSTILPQTAAELASLHIRHEQHYLASPVFGRPGGSHRKKTEFYYKRR